MSSFDNISFDGLTKCLATNSTQFTFPLAAAACKRFLPDSVAACWSKWMSSVLSLSRRFSCPQQQAMKNPTKSLSSLLICCMGSLALLQTFSISLFKETQINLFHHTGTWTTITSSIVWTVSLSSIQSLSSISGFSKALTLCRLAGIPNCNSHPSFKSRTVSQSVFPPNIFAVDPLGNSIITTWLEQSFCDGGAHRWFVISRRSIK